MTQTTAPSAASGPRLLLIGCGKMGAALLKGWLDGALRPRAVAIVEASEAARAAFPQDDRVQSYADLAALPETLAVDFVIFAVKPQQMDTVLGAAVLQRFVAQKSCFLSIAAGKTLSYFASHLGDKAALVRAMPNTPSAVGRGMTVLVANGQTDGVQRQICAGLLQAVGQVEWVQDEDLMDAVTAVSGSGPAYVFYLIEALAEAGRQAGLPGDLALKLSHATVCGAGELAYRATDSATTLRENVTSPGGTTQAALDILMAEEGLQPLLNRTVGAATARSRVLGAS